MVTDEYAERMRTEALEMLREGRARQVEWIRVEDDYPEDCERVLAWDGRFTYYAAFEAQSCQFEDRDSDVTYDIQNVSHWLRLPAPPVV